MENNPRAAGETKWSIRSLLHYGIEGIISFNNKPLRICFYLGTALISISILYILLGIVVLLGVILSMRLKIYIRMTDTFGLRAGLGPVVLTLAPAKPKKPVDPEDFTYEKHQKRLQKERARALKKAEKAEKKKQAKALAKEAEKTAKEEAAAEEKARARMFILLRLSKR